MKENLKSRLAARSVAGKAALVLVLASVSSATVIAQAPPAAPAAPAAAPGAAGAAPVDRELMQARIGGSVAVEGTNIISQLRRFEPNKRTYWHTHDGGFILFVQEGKARVQKRGEMMKELKVGEMDYTPPGVEHWHGSAPDEALMQLGVIPGGGRVQFLEPVTDAQYNGKSK